MAADGFSRELTGFNDYLRLELELSERTVSSYDSDLSLFFAFLLKRGVSPDAFTEADIEAYLIMGGAKEASSAARFICSLRSYCRYLTDTHKLEADPCAKIRSPRVARKLPQVMSENCVEAFLEAPDTATATGLRDKAMLETVYATGLRVSELCSLRFDSLHLNDGFLSVRGKGGKDRLVPLGENAVYWIENYAATARAQKDPKRQCPYVFLSGKGTGPLTRIAFWYRIKHYAQELGITQDVSPHSFRHAFATHLLNHDADLRVVQMMLGHSSLTTTQIYTHVATRRMHDIYNKTHPRA